MENWKGVDFLKYKRVNVKFMGNGEKREVEGVHYIL